FLYLVQMENNGFVSHLLSIILLPGIMVGAIPYYLHFYFPEPTIYEEHILLKIGSYVFIAFGIIIFILCVGLFASIGKGTLAPWFPTSRLVVSGPYRFVRNPMIIGIISIIIGEALFYNSIIVLIWGVVFFAINSIYFEFFEERRLETKFGEAYLDYKESVPKWIPSLKPYKPE
ncbi:MAG: isoprenylcysteine carboxylmethyltransferase family protein, partial [Flavobacteriaceae bacterium]|nr:isoprenylcysteine carboxylmethyltransferase family protein [Flavobacteriaceae bacterium]